MKQLFHSLPGLLLACAISGSGLAQTPPAPDVIPSAGLLGSPEFFRPSGKVEAVAVLYSDRSGWGEAERQAARTLSTQGVAVLGVDLPSYLAVLDKDPDPCQSLYDDIEYVSHQAQRLLKLPDYKFPVIAGLGEGGAVALALAGQVEQPMLARVIAIDPAPVMPLAKPVCTDAASTPSGKGRVYEVPPHPFPFPVEVLLTASAAPEVVQRVSAAGKRYAVRQVNGPAAASLTKPILLPPGAKTPPRLLEDLPLVEYPVPAAPPVIAILYSGDGGWREVDQTLAETLQKRGIPTVGVDVLRYFWKKRLPDETAPDLARIIRTYRAKWDSPRFALIGYSFGADVLPALYNRLSAKEKQMIVQLSLLAPADANPWEVTVINWLDVRTGKELPTLPELQKIDPGLLQCFYGSDDKGAICPELAKSGVDTIKTKGGHHFDGNYPALANHIADRLLK